MIPRRSLALIAPFAGLLAASAMAGSASAATQTLSCRASIARVNALNGGLVVEPFVANPNGSPCAGDTSGLATGQVLNIGGLGSLLGGALNVGPASANTASTSTDSSRGAQSTVSVSAVSIPTPAGAISVVGPVSTTASEQCVGGQVQTSQSSTLSALQIGSQRIALASPGQPDTIPLYGAINLLGQQPVIGDVALNQNTSTATSDTETLLDVHINGIADVTVGEAVVGQPASGACSGLTGGGDPSDPGNPSDPGSPSSPSSPNGSASSCPLGSVLSGGNCVLAGSPGIVISRSTASDISGGRVVSLAYARKHYRSACLKGSGPRFVVVGTKGRDRITVRRKRMRVLGLAGNDTITVKGGNRTCVDGGAGKDRIVNGQRNRVTIYGGTGNDRIKVGNGPAFVSGGAGNDVIAAGRGRDTIKAGAGRNVITARGAKVRVSASGRSTIAHLPRAAMAYARRHGVRHVFMLR